MPLLLLQALSPLLRKRDTYYVAAIVVLAALLGFSRRRVKADEAALAARPAVETKTEIQVKTVKVEGPERIVEKLVEGKVVERVVFRDPVVITTQKESDSDRSVKPACPAELRPWRYAGISAPGTDASKFGLRGGVTLWNALDVGLAARFSPATEGRVEVGVRF